MNETQDFSFGDDSVASAYDNVLVRILFEPWAEQLVEEHQPWNGRQVVDVATGTGIVAQLLASKVGPSGKVFGTDINAEMLSLAKKRCTGLIPEEMFIECPAHQLEISSNSIDYVVCQQGFQFFPDKGAAAQEIYRVLFNGGKFIASTWKPVSECQFFGKLCEALNTIGEPDMSDMMRVPFDFMPEKELIAHFESAGFVNVRIRQQELDMLLDGVAQDGVEVAYATPIAPKLRALPENKQKQFRNTFKELLSKLSNNGKTMGCMVSNILTGEKPN
jgi:ubiquinone/menaquinone biosynthesis C-methylase UbiE